MIVLAGNSEAQSRNSATESKISAMLKQMALAEKVGQMAQVSIESLGSIQIRQFCFQPG